MIQDYAEPLEGIHASMDDLIAKLVLLRQGLIKDLADVDRELGTSRRKSDDELDVYALTKRLVIHAQKILDLTENARDEVNML